MNASSSVNQRKKVVNKWQKPATGTLKLYVHASSYPRAQSFSIGMVLRDDRGTVVARKTLRLPEVDSIFEAEAVAVGEALSWIYQQQLQVRSIIIETDSMLTPKAIVSKEIICLEFGDVIEDCKQILSTLPSISIHFVGKMLTR